MNWKHQLGTLQSLVMGSSDGKGVEEVLSISCPLVAASHHGCREMCAVTCHK